MSFLHGKATTVVLGAVNLSPYLTGIDLSADVDTADTTVFGSTWKSAITGTGNGSVSFTGYYDPAEASIRTLLLAGTPGVLTYCPGAGTATGDPARLVAVLGSTLAESSPVGGVVAVSGGFTADAVVGFGRVLAPLAARSGGLANGTAVDLGTAAVGAVAHLNATAVSADHVVVHIEDSANGSTDWQDVAGFDFTELHAPGAARRIATGTVRRYVRAVIEHDGAVTSTLMVTIARTAYA